jgi:hypothetical protein
MDLKNAGLAVDWVEMSPYAFLKAEIRLNGYAAGGCQEILCQMELYRLN